MKDEGKEKEDIKTAIITIFDMFKEVKENKKIRGTQYIRQTFRDGK